MRYLRVADQTATINDLNVTCTPSQGTPRTAFTLGFIEVSLNLRVRSATIGNIVFVCRRLDDTSFSATDDASDGASRPLGAAGGYVTPDDFLRTTEPDENPNFVFVASDEGFTELTLRRICNLIVEVIGYIGIGDHRSNRLIKMLLLYIDRQMANKDLSFLNLSFERIDEAKIPAVLPGFTVRQYLGEYVKQALEDAPESRHPGYAVSLYGSKILLETNPEFTKHAKEVNGDTCDMNDSMRFIIALLAAAFFSSPYPRSLSDLLPTEQQIVDAEMHLRHIGITRHNVCREQVARVVDAYVAHLEAKVPGKLQPELNTAASCRRAYAVLKTWVEEQSRPIRQLYHDTDKLNPDRDEVWDPSDEFTFNFNCYSDDEDHPQIGRIQFVWTPVEPPADRNSTDDEFAVMYPHGVATAVLYFGNENWDQTVKRTIPPSIVHERLTAMCSPECLIFQFIATNWLTHPPLSGYSIPGLIAFVCIDRRRNQSLVCSREEMIGGCKTAEGKKSIQQLFFTMHHCICEAHQLIAQGFSEGLWGHLGMQFVYQIAIQRERDTMVAADGKQPVIENRTFNDTALARTVVETPFLIASTNRLENSQFVFEMYAMFVGVMTPKEVQAGLLDLKKKLLIVA